MRLIVLLMVLVSSFTFGEVNDSIKSLKKPEKEAIEARIDEVEETTNLSFYLNYSKEKDEPQLKETEKSVIINFVKIDNDTLKVKINFTQDIDVDNSIEEIEKTLDNLEEFLLEGKVGEYSIELLNSIEGILLKVDEEVSEKEETKKKSSKTGKILGILFLIILAVFIGKKKLKR